MGNGALPHGPSYRAHPRLYQMRSVSMSAIAPLLGAKRTQRGHHQIDVNDPERTRLTARGQSVNIAPGCRENGSKPGPAFRLGKFARAPREEGSTLLAGLRHALRHLGDKRRDCRSGSCRLTAIPRADVQSPRAEGIEYAS
jgi:hypothetical protein